MVEKKIHAAMIAKDDDMLEKYNLEDITKFVKNKLGSIVQTYRIPIYKRSARSCVRYSPLASHGAEMTIRTPKLVNTIASAISDVQNPSISFGTHGPISSYRTAQGKQEFG